MVFVNCSICLILNDLYHGEARVCYHYNDYKGNDHLFSLK